MLCPSCGGPNPDTARFCGTCATPLPRTLPCRRCGTPNPAGGRFCHQCAASLDEGPAGNRTPEAERKQVTVLFADVKGSMELTAGMDPEEWGELMERFFAILREAVNRFGGRIDKFTGDGVMALFGAPVAYEDHARQACEAALALRDDLAHYAGELQRERGIRFQVRMGLNSGEVVAGAVGQDLKVEYTAVGNTVGLAQRMEALAEPGSAYLTAATASLVEGFFELRPLGPMRAKGADEAVTVFELVGYGAHQTSLEVAAARGFTHFVGRDREMAVLDSAFADAKVGNGRVIGLVAEPGIGKSRLCHEFADRAQAQGIDAVRGHGLSHARSVPFLPMLEILRNQFGISEQDDAAAARATVARDVLTLDDSLGPALPLLYDFLAIGDPDQPPPVTDPEARQRRLFGALNRVWQARCAEKPLVVIVEDLHWLDPGSTALLEYLVNAAAGMRLLVVTTFRPEFRAPWTHRAHYLQIPLAPLGDQATGELVADLLGPDPSLDGVAGLVRERTGGNPFFIEEVVQTLVEEGSLAGGRGAYQLARTIEQVRIPATVQAVLAARIDRLSEAEKALLQAAAVIGRQFSGRLASRVAGLDDKVGTAALRALVDAEFVYETASFPEEEFTFKHALTEEVAYRSQIARHRARTHAAVAEALTELDRDRLDERASLIAHHYELGGRLLDAARWNARAATWVGYAHPTEVIRHWRRVVALTDRLEASPETSELGVTARIQLLTSLWRLGAAGEEGGLPFEEEAAQAYAEGRALAEGLDRADLSVLLMGSYAANQILTEGVEEGFQLLPEAARLADEVGNPTLRVLSRIFLGWTFFTQGRVVEEVKVTRELESIIGEDRSLGRGMGLASPYVYCQLHLALFRAHVGPLDEGLVALEQVAELAGEEGDFESQAWAHRHWAIFADVGGMDPEAVAAHARQAFEWAEDAGGAWARIYGRQAVATSLAQRGHWAGAIDMADEALTMAGDRRIAQAEIPLLLSIKARAQTGQGDLEGARSSAEEAIAVAQRCRTRFYEAQARHQLARAILARGAPGDAEVAARELATALSAVEELGIRVYAPLLHLELAQGRPVR